MVTNPTQIWREPQSIAQGDTLTFTRNLNNYPAGAGWSLLYALRGGAQAIQFTSIASGNNHVITVPAATTETWIPAEYLMEGWAVFTDNSRYQIYLAPLWVTPDLATAAGGLAVTTHAQRMLALVEVQLEAIAANVLDMTDVEGTRIQRAKRAELFALRAKYFHERRGEIARARAKSKLPSQRKIKTVLSIMPPGALGIRQWGAGSSVYNDDIP